MAFAGVDDGEAEGAPAFEEAAIGLDCSAKVGHVVAEGFAEAARFEEVSLHIDDEEGAARRIERKGVGLGFNFDGWHFQETMAVSGVATGAAQTEAVSRNLATWRSLASL